MKSFAPVCTDMSAGEIERERERRRERARRREGELREGGGER